jgi:hypothetical protein
MIGKKCALTSNEVIKIIEDNLSRLEKSYSDSYKTEDFYLETKAKIQVLKKILNEIEIHCY